MCGVELRKNAKFCHKCGAAAPEKVPGKKEEMKDKPIKPASPAAYHASAPTGMDKTAGTEPKPKLISTMPPARKGSPEDEGKWFTNGGDL